jgi:alkylation response protein AidB-like acyl-CoA dehydrogenase
MDLALSSDQTALRDAFREFLEKESPYSVVRAAEPLGFDASLWRKVVGLGFVSLAIPEQRGGGGGGMVELAVAAECLGEYLAPVPLIEAATANHLLVELSVVAGSDVASYVSGAVAGELLATLAIHPATDHVARLVPAAAVADLVIALDGEELVLVVRPAVSPTSPAPVIPNLGALPLGHCKLGEGTAFVLARGPEAVAAHRRAVSRWKALTAAALVGLGSRALDLALEYVQQRRAFGVLIANFQTIQHRLADDVTALEGARLLAYEAAWSDVEQQANASSLATMAYLFAAQSAFKTASDSLHFHGGYGYTLEYDIQLYFRRAKSWSLLAGDPRHQCVDLVRQLIEAGGG